MISIKSDLCYSNLYILTDDFNRIYNLIGFNRASAGIKIDVMPTIKLSCTQLHPRSTMHGNEDSLGRFDVRQETDIASVRTDDVTHGSSYAGNKNAVRRGKKYNRNAMGTSE